MAKSEIDPLAAVITAVIFAIYGIKSVVEYVADVCIQVIQFITSDTPLVGFIGILSIAIIVLRYKTLKIKEFVSSLKTIIKK